MYAKFPLVVNKCVKVCAHGDELESDPWIHDHAWLSSRLKVRCKWFYWYNKITELHTAQGIEIVSV